MITCKLSDKALHLYFSPGPVNAGVDLEQGAPLGSHAEYRDIFQIHPGCPEKSTRGTEGPRELPCEGLKTFSQERAGQE